VEARTPTPTIEESTIVERVARIVASGHAWRGAKPDYTRLAAELEPAIPFDVFGVVLLRHDRQAVRVTVCRREADSWVAQYHQLPLEDSMMAQLLHNPAMVVQNYPGGLDGPPAQSGDALSGSPHLRATLIAPLIVGDRVLGTLELGSTVLNTYADETLQRLIKAVVHVLAAAIESAQTGGNVEIQDRQRQALKQVSRALTSTRDLSTILERIVVGIADALHVASAIVTFGRCKHGVCLEAQSGLDPVILRTIVESATALSDQSIIGYTLQRRQPFVSQDIDTDERFPSSRVFATELAIRSIFSYPLVTETTVYGTLLLCSLEPGGFTPLKADVLSLFASQATIAIHNSVLLEAAQQRSHFQKAIERLEWAHVQKADEHELLERVREETERTFGISFSSLVRFISDHLLTRNERDLQALLPPAQKEYASDAPLQVPQPRMVVQGLKHFPTLEQAVAPQTLFGTPDLSRPDLWGTSMAWLTQTSEAALARTEILGELSRLLQLYEQSTGDRTDGWFVVDLNGQCMYMNPAAEVFCGIRLMNTDATASDVTLEDIFAAVLPRVRNVDEVSLYLRDFAAGALMENSPGEAPTKAMRNFNNDTIRCVLAVELVNQGRPHQSRESDAKRAAFQTPRSLHASRSKEKDRSSTDHYYQFIRYPLYNRNGQLLARALRVHDITEQVRDEKNKSALLSSVSHDLRTPLTTIKAAVTGLLQPGVEWDEQTRQQILEEVDCETDHLTVLINALVEMSRIEMDALVLEKEWCDVVEIMHSALTRVERILAGQPVHVPAMQSPLPLIQVDYVQLERVFYNLIENAARRNRLAEEEDKGQARGVREPHQQEIVVTLGVVDADGETESFRKKMVRARVTDHGPEVPESERERIFKMFYSQESAPGSGLGLAICRGIVEAHQGQIWVESTSDGGTCFVFILPVHFGMPSRTSPGEFR